jgi:hypothetical protein
LLYLKGMVDNGGSRIVSVDVIRRISRIVIQNEITRRVVGPQFLDLFWPVACGLWDFFFLKLLAALVCKR